MSRFDDLLTELAQVELAPAPSISILEDRVRGRARKKRYGALSLAGVALVTLGVAIHQRSNPVGPTLSSQVTAFVTSGPPRLLNSAVSFGYLPANYHLISDRQINSDTKPANYSRSITFGSQSGSDRTSFTFTLNQGVENPVFTTPPPGGVANAKTSSIEVNGLPALMEVVSSTPVVSKSVGYVDGRKVSTYSVFCPAAGSQASKASSFCSQAANQRVGPPGLFAQPFSTANPTIVVQWRLNPEIGIQLVGHGIDAAQLVEIADGVQLNMAVQSCIQSGSYLTSGLCSPGLHASPSINTPSVPIGGTELAYGTASRTPWVFSASVTPGNAWMEIVYGTQAVTASGSTIPAPTINWDNALDGQEFVSGMVPSSVTSVSVSTPKKSIRSAVLPASISGWHFFVLPMGKTSSYCNGVCNDPISVTFYHGSTVVGRASAANTETSWSGIRIKG